MLQAVPRKAAGEHKRLISALKHWSSRARNTEGSDGKPWGKRSGIIHTPAPAPQLSLWPLQSALWFLKCMQFVRS